MLNGGLFPLGRIDLNLRDNPGKKEKKRLSRTRMI